MSTVQDRKIIDITSIEDGKYVLVITDDLEWKHCGQQHARILQDKIYDYLGYIDSGQANEDQPGLNILIRIISQYSYSKYAIEFLERIRKYISDNYNNCNIEWTHLPGDGPFNDGYSDEYIFDASKIYPRLKKNWAKNPLKEVSFLPFNGPLSNDNLHDNMIMFRTMDSFIICLLADLGDMYGYLTYDNIPKDMTVQQLEEIAFNNLRQNIQFRSSESIEPGIYGILAGGDFEAESLCLYGIWQEIADELDDDLIICVPTKDLVFYTKASNRKLRKKMIKMAREAINRNRKESPLLIFSNDIFYYSRKDNTLTINKKYKL